MTDIRIDGRDMREGMGIGGWDMEWTATHIPSGCKVVWQTHGSEPMSQHRMREHALSVLGLMAEIYPTSQGPAS